MTYRLLQITIWMLLYAVSDAYMSENVLNFLTLFNGQWNNKAQIVGGLRERDFIQLKIRQVDVPSLRPDTVVYVEENDNRKIRAMNLGIVTEGILDVMYVTLYNFTDATKYRPDSFNISELSNVTRDQLRQENYCVAAFEFAGKGDIIVGNWPVCNLNINGKPAIVALMFTCDYHTGSVPFHVDVTPTLVPYALTHVGDRYPLINAPDTYVSPCQKSDCENLCQPN